MTYSAADFTAQANLKIAKALRIGESSIATKLSAISTALGSDTRGVYQDMTITPPPAALDPSPVGTSYFTQDMCLLVNRGLDGGLTPADMKTAVDAIVSGISYPPVANVHQPPVASGNPAVDGVLSVTLGDWQGGPNTPTSFAYQWTHAGSTNISAATAGTYTVVDADQTYTVGCTVSATNADGTVAAKSNLLGPVADLRPANTVAPAVTGTPTVGQVLTTTNGTWTGSPSGYTYQWTRDGSNIGAATASTYTLVSGDATHNVACKVTATNAHGTATTASNAVAVTS